MNDQIVFAIKTGIESGVITAVILWFLRQIFIHVISPRLEQFFYNGVLLDGTWNATVGKNEHRLKRTLTINLRQRGNKLNGTFYARAEDNAQHGDKEKHEYSNQYKIEGTISDNYAVLKYCTLSRNRTGLGSLVLKITHGGTKLKGGIVFLAEGDSGNVDTLDDVEFIRSI